MCKAKHYSEQLQKIFKEINNEYINLSGELSHADLYEQDVLHKIEDGGFNAADGYKLAKMLCDNRQKRRQIKNELEPLRQLKSEFVDKNFQGLTSLHTKVVSIDKKMTTKTYSKSYAPKVIDVVAEIKPVKSIGAMRYRKDNRELLQLTKVEGDLFYAKFKDGNKSLVNKKDILNFDESKII